MLYFQPKLVCAKFELSLRKMTEGTQGMSMGNQTDPKKNNNIK